METERVSVKRDVGWRRNGRGDCLMGVEYTFGVLKMFWKVLDLVVAQHYKVLNATKL